ncbi:expressed unknown protein [Seminavis robusta]|uniref:Transmembrane protein n=1 Tax=Seminavis robusta TaxID=568900 RepID=A0A9N8HS31_9STRA|nr:expressed unknown protein [Seminavis robusta]|eukprot:Sro1469_g275350.1 n/a (421) ;mRNA; f:23776-25163
MRMMYWIHPNKNKNKNKNNHDKRNRKPQWDYLGVTSLALVFLHGWLGQATLLSCTVASGTVGMAAIYQQSQQSECQERKRKEKLYGWILGILLLMAVMLCTSTTSILLVGDGMDVLWEVYRGFSLAVLIFITQHLLQQCLQVQLARSSIDKTITSKSAISTEDEDANEDDTLSSFRTFLAQDKQKLNQQKKKRSPKKSPKRKSSSKRSKSKQEQQPATTNESILLQSCLRTTSSSNHKDLVRGDLRSVRFAEDDNGLETVFEISKHQLTTQRVLVLLLLPQVYAYEFVALEYDILGGDTGTHTQQQQKPIRIAQLLQLLPSLASDPTMARQTFLRLLRMDCSTHKQTNKKSTTPTEMINALTLQSYNLQNDEILVAVPRGSTPAQVMESSKQVLQNPKLMKALRRNKTWGIPIPSQMPSQ